MKWSIIIFSILVMFCCKFAAADDSIPSKQLKEVIVLGDNQWIEKGVMNFIPSKTRKNFLTVLHHLLNLCISPL